MTAGKAELKARVCAEIERRAEDIVRISEHIMRHPESGFREVRTAQYVCGELDRMGLAYRSGLALTGVKARMSGRTSGPTVGILGELDSLIVSDHPYADPVTGAAHACGHFAQIASMLGAGMGLQPVMGQLDGDVVLFAVPAEECIEVDWRIGLREQGKLEFIVGKAELIRLGEFDDVDMITITHTPARADGSLATVGDTHNGCVVKRARFLGRADQAGPLRDRDRTEIAPADAGIAEGALEHAADVAQVLARGELGDDAAPLTVQRDLRGDDVGADAPRLVGRAGLLDDRRRRLVARALDAEDQHGSRSARRADGLAGVGAGRLEQPPAGSPCSRAARCPSRSRSP